jgi:hypothetical protein
MAAIPPDDERQRDHEVRRPFSISSRKEVKEGDLDILLSDDDAIRDCLYDLPLPPQRNATGHSKAHGGRCPFSWAAQETMLATDEPLSQIALASGFADQAHLPETEIAG